MVRPDRGVCQDIRRVARECLIRPLPNPDWRKWSERLCQHAAPAHIGMGDKLCGLAPELNHASRAQQLRQHFESGIAHGQVAHMPTEHDIELSLTRSLVNGAAPNPVAQVQHRTVEQKEREIEFVERRKISRPDQYVLDVRVHRGGCGGERSFVAKAIPRRRPIVALARNGGEGDDFAAAGRQQPRCRCGHRCAVEPRAQMRADGAVRAAQS